MITTEQNSLDDKKYVESIFILYRIKYQKIKIDLTSPLRIRETFITSNFPKLRFLYIWIGFFL